MKSKHSDIKDWAEGTRDEREEAIDRVVGKLFVRLFLAFLKI